MAKYQSRDGPRDSEKTAVCPFFCSEQIYKGKRYLYCEGCRVDLKDRLMRREIVYKLCADPDGYKECFMYKALMNYWERGDKSGKK